jgi:4-hydroxy-2-oxoheptanedioate aldolase
MAGFTLRNRLANGDRIFAAWISSGNPRIAEATVSTGFEAAFFDIQHGEGSFGDVRDGIAAVRLAGKPAGVRVGLEGYSDAARLFDLGAEVAIMPMVNSAEDAARLVDALKYPPMGGRSWGPPRGVNLLGMTLDTYRAAANQGTIVFAMVETQAAVDALDAILAVPGLDGVFVGPSDLSISLSKGAKLDHRMPEAVEVMKNVVKKAKAKGKATAIFCAGGEAAARNAALGFDVMAIGSDWGFLADGAKAALEAARGQAAEGGARY